MSKLYPTLIFQSCEFTKKNLLSREKNFKVKIKCYGAVPNLKKTPSSKHKNLMPTSN